MLVSNANPRTNYDDRDGTSGELKYTLEGHSLGVHSVDTNHDGSRKITAFLYEIDLFLFYNEALFFC